MAYRRADDDDGVFGPRWRIAHRGELAACGVPADAVAADRRWTYLLLHGDDPASGWDPSWLSDEQARRLLAVLDPHVPNAAGVDLVATLRRRCGPG